MFYRVKRGMSSIKIFVLQCELMPCNHAICTVQNCFQWGSLVKRRIKFRIP